AWAPLLRDAELSPRALPALSWARRYPARCAHLFAAALLVVLLARGELRAEIGQRALRRHGAARGGTAGGLRRAGGDAAYRRTHRIADDARRRRRRAHRTRQRRGQREAPAAPKRRAP